MIVRILIALVVGLATYSFALAEEAKRGVAKAEVSRPNLLDKLATTNLPATIRGEPGDERATWSKRDVEEAKRVDAAVKDVIRQAEELWPELVDHLGDDRYCKTVGIDAGYPRNWSVGDICQHIIGETLSES